MKNFFSQTWVVALLVAAVLAVVCWLAFGKKQSDDETKDPTDDKEKGQE